MAEAKGFASRQLFLLLVFVYIYVLLIFSLFLSLLRLGNSFAWEKMKPGYSRFPQAGVHRLDFRCRSNANDGNKLPRTYPVESPPIKKDTQGVFFYWRKLRDSNPCAFWANGFQDRLVMTTSISFRLYKVDSNFLIDFIYYILNKNKNQMIEAIFQTFLSIAAFYNFVNSFSEFVF